MDTEKSALHSTPTCQEDEIQRRQLRLYFFFVLTIWTLVAIAAPIVFFCVTKSLYSFSLLSTLAPPIYLWHRFTKHLFPMDEKTYQLKKLQIEMMGQNSKVLRNSDQDKLK